MKTLKTLALIGASALAVSAVSTAAVQAQPYGHNYGPHYGAAVYDRARLNPHYLDQLSWRIDNALRRQMISYGEARIYHKELGEVRGIAWRAQNGRANDWEVRRLESTINRVESATSRYASNDRYDRYRYDRHGDWRR